MLPQREVLAVITVDLGRRVMVAVAVDLDRGWWRLRAIRSLALPRRPWSSSGSISAHLHGADVDLRRPALDQPIPPGRRAG
jgi:hypothetical protein